MSPTPAWHAIPLDKLLETLGTHFREGLQPDQVLERQSQHGMNRLAETLPLPLWKKFAGQFADIIIWILISAALIAGVLGEWLDAGAILAIVLMNGVLDFCKKKKAQRELSAMSKRSAYSARVIRGGKQYVVVAEELVPGDLIELEAGDHIPADSRLIETIAYGVQESALTGESVSTHKDASVILPGERASRIAAIWLTSAPYPFQGVRWRSWSLPACKLNWAESRVC